MELGQIVFSGHQMLLEHEIDDEAVSEALFKLFEQIGLSCYGQPNYANTTVMTGDGSDEAATFRTEQLTIYPFDWSGETEEPANIIFHGGRFEGPKAGEFEGIAIEPFSISFYKYLGRSMRSDRPITSDDIELVIKLLEISLPDDFFAGCEIYSNRGRVKRYTRGTTKTGNPMLNLFLEVNGKPYRTFFFASGEETMNDHVAILNTALEKGCDIAFSTQETKAGTYSRITRFDLANERNVA